MRPIEPSSTSVLAAPRTSVAADELSFPSRAASPGGTTRIPRWGPPTMAGACAAVVLGLGLYHLSAQSISLDEAQTVRLSQNLGLSGVLGDGGNMAFYYLFIKIWGGLGRWSLGEWGLRLPSVVFASASVLLLYALVRRIGRTAAAVACLLLAVNASLIVYAQDARSYTLELLLVIGSWLALARAIERGSLGRWIVYAGLAILAIDSQLLAAPVILTQLLSLALLPSARGRPWTPTAWAGQLRRAPRWKAWPLIAAAGTAAALTVLVVVKAVSFGWGYDQNGYIRPTNAGELRNVAAFVSGATTGPATGTLMGLYTVAIGAAAVISIRTLRSRPRSYQTWLEAVPLLWLVLPSAGILLLSLARPMTVSRYFIGILPAGMVLAALAIARLGRPLMVVTTAALVALGAFTVGQTYSGVTNAPFRAAAQFVFSDHPASGDAMVFVPLTAKRPFSYYRVRAGIRYLPGAPRGPHLCNPANEWAYSPPRPQPAVERAVASMGHPGRLWVLATTDSRTCERWSADLVRLLRTGSPGHPARRLLAERNFDGWMTVYALGPEAPSTVGTPVGAAWVHSAAGAALPAVVRP